MVWGVECRIYLPLGKFVSFLLQAHHARLRFIEFSPRTGSTKVQHWRTVLRAFDFKVQQQGRELAQLRCRRHHCGNCSRFR